MDDARVRRRRGGRADTAAAFPSGDDAYRDMSPAERMAALRRLSRRVFAMKIASGGGEQSPSGLPDRLVGGRRMTHRGLVVAPIGVVRSPFTAKFGVPRQAGLVDVRASIELDPEVVERDALRGLEGVSHLWVIWWFHRHEGARARATVRPPRLGGNTRLGVLATRSPFRPNPIGLSAVRVLGIEGLRIDVLGLDAIDGTPVVDLKPYVPGVDAIPDARIEWMEPEAAPRPVVFTPAAEAALADHPRAEELRALVVAMLEADPRPAYRRGKASPRVHGMNVLDVDVRFSIDDAVVTVHDIVRAR